jgi:hypothetical protein
MRRHLVSAVILASLVIGVAAALAAGKTTLTLDGKARPSNLPAGHRAGVTLHLKETTDTSDPSGVPPQTTKAEISLDRDFKVTSRGLPRCHPNQITGKSTAEARSNCKSSMVGTGSAVARLSNGAGGHVDLPAVVSAFNGVPRNGTPLIVLHTVLPGGSSVDIVLLVENGSGAYGTVLSTPPGPKEPIHSFTLNLHRAFKFHGHPRSYVSAMCSDGKLLYKARFSYDSGPPRTDTDTQSCQ